jgi:hypothetical protein
MCRPKSGKGGGWSVVAGILCLAGGLAGCASPGGSSERFEHAKLGYTISYPERIDPSQQAVWHRLKVEDADLAYRGPGDSMMAISSRCNERQTDPAVLGRQLLIGLRNRIRLTSERFEFAGGLAFSQVVRSKQGDVSVRTKTVTLVRGGCVIDWVLAAPDPPPELEQIFDLWWRGFDPGAMPSPAEDPVDNPVEVGP